MKKITILFPIYASIRKQDGGHQRNHGFTIVEQALTLVPEFNEVVRQVNQQVELRGQSKERQAIFSDKFKKTAIRK